METIHVKESTIIRPAQETPRHCLRLSDLDLLMPASHIPSVYFYRRPNYPCNFFEGGLLKEALSKVLVPFYPLAGRLGEDENGRIEINCNGEGVLFIEAETSCVTDDFGDFESSSKLVQLVPPVDRTKDACFHPLIMAQVTHFKCGGVSLGLMMHHLPMDGTTAYHFMNSWAEMTRGIPISVPPIFDRTILDVGVPTSPSFHHIEYDPPPSMNSPTQNPQAISTAILKQQPDLTVIRRDPKIRNCPNLLITKLADMPMYEVDLRWGRPVFTMPVSGVDGEVFILPGPTNDGSWSVAVGMETSHLQHFNKFFMISFRNPTM